MEYDPNGVDGKEGFRLFEDGFFKNKVIKTRHPNILKSVIIAKKGWGLWLNEWTNGITDWSFTKDEIFVEFEKNNILIPEPFLLDFNNVLERERQIRNLKYYNEIKNLEK